MERRILLMGSVLLVFFTIGGISYAQSTKPIELKLAHAFTAMHTQHVNLFVPFANEVAERSKGRVKITIYPNEALGKAKDQYDMTVQGVTDIGQTIFGLTTGRFPLVEVVELPFLVSSSKIGSRIVWELYEKKYFEKEFSSVKVLTLFTLGPGHLILAKKTVRKLEDLKGMRLRSPGPQQTALLRQYGASPLTLSIADTYDALQHGMIDGMVSPISAITDFKLTELVKHVTISDIYVLAVGLVMNLDKWNSLPPDIQKIINESSGQRLSQMIGEAYDKSDSSAYAAAKKAGVEIYNLPEAERNRWVEKAKPVVDKWITDVEAKGLPGKKIYDEAYQLRQKYTK